MTHLIEDCFNRSILLWSAILSERSKTKTNLSFPGRKISNFVGSASIEPEAFGRVSVEAQSMQKPILAKVKGAAAGAGVALAAACDLIIAEEEAFFTLAYCHIGITPDGSSSFHLPRAIGLKRTLEMTLLGDRYTAQQMADMGLINFVVPAADFGSQSAELVQRLAEGPTHVYGMAKKLMYRSLENEFESQLQLESECFAECVIRKDFREGVTAFVEKRKARFTGK